MARSVLSQHAKCGPRKSWIFLGLVGDASPTEPRRLHQAILLLLFQDGMKLPIWNDSVVFLVSRIDDRTAAIARSISAARFPARTLASKCDHSLYQTLIKD
jgi:hypothetical protein